jgi:hypothetical protein
MVVIEDRNRHVVNSVGEQPAMPSPTMPSPTMPSPTMSSPRISSRTAADARREWVAPTWERRDTPMEVTMYAGQR